MNKIIHIIFALLPLMAFSQKKNINKHDTINYRQNESILAYNDTYRGYTFHIHKNKSDSLDVVIVIHNNYSHNMGIGLSSDVFDIGDKPNEIGTLYFGLLAHDTHLANKYRVKFIHPNESDSIFIQYHKSNSYTIGVFLCTNLDMQINRLKRNGKRVNIIKENNAEFISISDYGKEVTGNFATITISQLSNDEVRFPYTKLAVKY